MMLQMMFRLLAVFLFASSAAALAATPDIARRPIELQTAQGTLYGSLLVPRADRPVPVVLMISGSGPTDRDGNNPEAGRNDSLKKLALLLAQNNIASVRYDKRGVATGRKATPDERDLSVAGYVDDAVAWSAQLKRDPRFGPLVILGHSEGALIATLAAQRAGANAVVSLSGSGRPLGEVLREQIGERLPAELQPRSYQLIERLEAGQYDPDVPQPLQVLFRPSVQPYLISLLRQDPAQAFAALKIPALIVQGSHDIQVGVGDAQALQRAKPDAQLAIIPGMNHVLRIVPMDLPSQLKSYRDHNRPLAAELGRVIVPFIQGL